MHQDELENLIFEIACDMVLSNKSSMDKSEAILAEEVVLAMDALYDWLTGASNPRLELEFQDEILLLGGIIGYPKPNWM